MYSYDCVSKVGCVVMQEKGHPASFQGVGTDTYLLIVPNIYNKVFLHFRVQFFSVFNAIFELPRHIWYYICISINKIYSSFYLGDSRMCRGWGRLLLGRELGSPTGHVVLYVGLVIWAVRSKGELLAEYYRKWSL